MSYDQHAFTEEFPLDPHAADHVFPIHARYHLDDSLIIDAQ